MKKVINIIGLMFLMLLFICNSVYATAIPVTDENLIEAFQKFVKSEVNEGNYKISVSNNLITVSVDNENYTLKYDLTNKPTFLFEIPIEKGMSYYDFKNQIDNLILPMLGYIAVADIQGAKMEDASIYFLFSYLGNALNGLDSSKNSYIIYDDLKIISEGVTIEKTDNSKTIYTSEFGDRIIEYVDSLYKEKQNISDEKEINSFSFSIEKQDTSETSRKLISTLRVNTDADFSKINGYADKFENAFTNKDITKENADYILALKAGQKCKIESSERITGFELYNNDCIEFNKDNKEITAIKSGVTNGYIYIGNNIKKSIYIIIGENTDNSSLETVTLKIDNVSDKDILEENTQKDSETKVENKLNIDILPRTGEKINRFLIVLYVIVGTCSIALIVLLLIKRKRK